jgi:hypothetical protein
MAWRLHGGAGLELAPREPSNEVAIPIQEIVVGKPVSGFPPDLVERIVPQIPAEAGHAVENQQDWRFFRVLEFIANDLRADFGVDPKFFAKLTLKGNFRALARLHFTAWEFPLESMAVAGTPLANQNLSISLDNGRHHHKHLSRRHVALQSLTQSGVI